MTTGNANARRLIYMVQTRDHASRQGIYSAVALVLAAGSWILHAPPLLFGAFSVVGAYFLVGSLTNWVAHGRHKRAVQLGEASNVDGDPIAADEVAQEIDLGIKGGVIRFICSNATLSSHRDCVEKIRRSILSDQQGFARKFAHFRVENAKKYPKYADFISTLQIQSLRIFPEKGKGQCIALIRFAGDVGEVWSTRYTGESFSELIWV
jgi:hypothetical protein